MKTKVLLKHSKISNKIKYIIESENNDSVNNDNKCMKIKFILNDNLTLKKN